MTATTLPASPMVADPYATPRPMVRRTLADGTLIVTVPNEGPRRRMADRFTAEDRAAIIAHATMTGAMCGAAYPADNWADRRRAATRSAIACTTAHLRPSELAWIGAVGGVAFLAAKLDAAGGEHHG